MRRIVVVAIGLTLTGCAQWSTETKVEEAVYQMVHVVDVLQTLAIANHYGCYQEEGDVHELYGAHPNRTQVLTWGVADSALHAGVTHLLENHTSTRWPQRVWQALTIGSVASVVHHNWELGLRLDWATGPIHAQCDAPPTQGSPPALGPPPNLVPDLPRQHSD
jgi:hypothetical protein